jgi:phosphoglycerol transferase MdoB-like AlkP superfamily enzyme
VRSPVFGSGSANAEFEVLTGLSMRFLPVGSLPYRQYIHRDLPALPRLFRDHGHRTVGILVDPPSYFDRPATYPHLGFDEVVWLDEEEGVERDASGRWATDQTVIDRIVTTLADERPAFVFAFTNATHAPYSRSRFPRSDLDVLDAPTPSVREELSGYANALREADRAVADLTRRLAALDEPTLLVVLGDHQPPLESFPALEVHQGPDRRRSRHAVPILLWTSFPALRRELEGPLSGVGSEILETLGLEPGPLLRVARGPAEAYRLVQHDVLFGAPALQNWFSPAVR